MENRIIIYSPSFDSSSGGIIVLHKLCHILIMLGFDAYLYPMYGSDFYVNDTYEFNITREVKEGDIVIYPEIVLGNPLNSKYVIRYIMNVGHITLNRKSTWGADDFWVYFSERFYDGLKEKNILHIIDSKMTYYKDYNVERSIESCHTFRKNEQARNDKSLHIHPSQSIEIGFNKTDEELINIFNHCKKFYSYDTETYLNILAALCGCESIIVPNDNFTKEDIKNKIPVCKYGIKYGDDDNIDWKGEKELLINKLIELENEPYKQLIPLIGKIKKHFKL
tara:strand:+ start:632 stop:1468 length:837 start_codon:yes stop_codon:yes gene_type:complete